VKTTAPPATPATRTAWEARLPFFYGWVIVAVAFLLSLMGSGLNWVAMGVFAVPMQEDTGWSRAALFSALGLRTYISAIASPFIGRYFDHRHGARLLSIGSGALMSLNLALISQVQSEWQFVLLFGGVGGLVSAGQNGQVAAIVPKWFVRRRSSAMAVATTGVGLAALVLPAVFSFFITAFGWRGAWTAVAVVTFVVAGLPALFIRRQPEDVGLLPDGGAAPDAANPRPRFREEASFTVTEAFRTRSAWLVLVATSFITLYSAGLPASLPAMLQDLGQPRDLAVLGLTIYGVGSVFGRWVWAGPSARYHVRWVMLAVTLYCALLTPTLPWLPPGIALAYPFFLGIGIGGNASIGQLVWPGYFGRAHLGAITGVARLPNALLGGVSATVLALSFDTFHDYGPALWLMSACGIVAVLAFLAAPPVAPPHRAATSTEARASQPPAG